MSDTPTPLSATDQATARPSDEPPRPTRGHRPRWRRPLPIIGLILLAALATAFVVALIPAPTSGLESRPDPAVGYDEAVRRFEQYVASEDDVFAPCVSRLFTHGDQTDVAVVLVHGLTNCPRQFVELGEELFDRGANVLILRMPYHGLASEDGEAIGGVANVGELRAEYLRDYADETVDIARGLGREVRVLGLSAGGVVTAWIAQNRPDVSRAVVVAPAISLPGGMPDFLDAAARNLFSRIPNLSLPTGGRLDHAYAGESTRALAEMFILAKTVEDEARERPPAAASIAVVTNGSDGQVDNGDVRRSLTEVWRAAGAEVDTYEFPQDLNLLHDLIDVAQAGERTDRVYPKLTELLGF